MPAPLRPSESSLAWPVSAEDMDGVAVVDLRQPLQPQILALRTPQRRPRPLEIEAVLSLLAALAAVGAAVTALLGWVQ